MSASSPKSSRPVDARLQNVIFRVIGAMHIGLYQLSRGKIGGRMYGSPVLLLKTRGRKTGKRRTTPLMYLQDGKDMVVIASKGGAPKDPMWWLNLKHAPEAEVQVGSSTMRVSVEEASPEQRQRLWPLAVAMYKGYADYQAKTTREIPLGILRPLT